MLHINLIWGFPGGSVVKHLPAVQKPQEMRIWSLGQEVPLEEPLDEYGNPLQYSCLENPMDTGASWAMVGQDWSNLARTCTVYMLIPNS